MTKVTIPTGLLPKGEVNGYTNDGEIRKANMHRDGKAFLKKVAQALDYKLSEVRVSSNMGGIAVSGEVTLHTDELYIWIQGDLFRSGLVLTYRTCKGRDDYCGGANHMLPLEKLVDPENRAIWLATLAKMRDNQRGVK